MLCFFKKWRGLCLAALAVILSVSLWPDPAPALQDVEKLKRGVVLVVAGRSSGTGFIINKNFIVTNHHVIKGARKVAIYPVNSRTGYRVEVVLANEALDIALLKSSQPLPGTPVTLTLKLKDADKVFAVGFPGVSRQVDPSVTPTFTEGTVSRILNRPQWKPAWEKAVQHDANIHPGNSGGPLVDDCDRVVGINTLVHQKASSVNVASHISELIKILKQNSISYKSSATKCVPPSSGADSQAHRQVAVLNNLLNQLTQQMIIGGSIGGVLLLAALALALRKPRARIIHAAKQVKEQVSGYSRKVEDGVSRALGGKAGAPHHLVLAGFDQGGHALRLKLDRRQLADRWGVTIGRAPSLVEQALPGAMISRRHARFVWRDQGYGVEDLNSSQGTFINGEKLEPYREAAFHTGDEISFGDLQLVISKS